MKRFSSICSETLDRAAVRFALRTLYYLLVFIALAVIYARRTGTATFIYNQF